MYLIILPLYPFSHIYNAASKSAWSLFKEEVHLGSDANPSLQMLETLIHLDYRLLDLEWKPTWPQGEHTSFTNIRFTLSDVYIIRLAGGKREAISVKNSMIQFTHEWAEWWITQWMRNRSATKLDNSCSDHDQLIHQKDLLKKNESFINSTSPIDFVLLLHSMQDSKKSIEYFEKCQTITWHP